MKKDSFFKKGLVSALLMASSLTAYSAQFGHDGQDGRNGMNGRSGRSGADLTITASNSPRNYSSLGVEGEDATSGIFGYDATSCTQPYMTRYNLWGAEGGDGGRGGSGGNGGNGGNFLIFYKSQSQLKLLTLMNPGAEGGRGAEGGSYGGDGCKCETYRWQFSTCSWALMKKRVPDENNEGWRDTGRRESTDCTNGRVRPPRPHQNPDVQYRWRFEGESFENYSCQDGNQGRAGANGRSGSHGSYGEITLVKGSSIPTTSPTYQGRLADSFSKFYKLTANVFLAKTGLKSLISGGSDTRDSYKEYERTDERKFSLNWQLRNGPAYYGLQHSPVSVSLYQSGASSTSFSVKLPGGLLHEVKQIDAMHWRINITGFEGNPPPPPPAGSCSEYNGKGSLLCEFSGACVYDEGICKKR